jgi:dolichol-phosphate mannosyltransferase
MKVCIIIPTYNESGNIEPLVKQVLELHPDFTILIVDDNSPDGTGDIADIMSREDPRIHVIHRPSKAGLGTAYVRGFKEALVQGADLVIEMDADLSHDPKYLKDLLEASRDADVVIGSRYVNGVRVEGWRFRRLVLRKLANMYVSYIMVRPIWDFTAGYRCYKRVVLETIDLNKIKSDGYAFQIEMTHLAYKHGFKVAEIPILFRERAQGSSKISRSVVWEAFWLTLRCRAPIGKILKHFVYFFKEYEEYIKDSNHSNTQ